MNLDRGDIEGVFAVGSPAVVHTNRGNATKTAIRPSYGDGMPAIMSCWTVH